MPAACRHPEVREALCQRVPSDPPKCWYPPPPGSSERCNAATEWKCHWTWARYWCPRVSCAKSPKVHGCASPTHGWRALSCRQKPPTCAKSPKVYGCAVARLGIARANPCTFGLLAHETAQHPHLRARLGLLAPTHPCTFADLAHETAQHPHLYSLIAPPHPQLPATRTCALRPPLRTRRSTIPHRHPRLWKHPHAAHPSIAVRASATLETAARAGGEGIAAHVSAMM